MADSTWFHGSAWRRSSQGMQPSGSCTDAIAPAVCMAWTAVRMPGTSGGTVDDQALAEDGVQGALRQPQDAGTADDVPHQQPVILPHRPRALVVGADQAAQPPVRRVQGVDVVGARDAEAGGRQPGPQLASAVDADVAAG